MSLPSRPAFTLSIDLVLPVSRHKVWRCWTEPELLKQWYCPQPWRVVEADMDARTGGRHAVVMQGPDGDRVSVPGVVLEVVPERRFVFTNAFERAWVPVASEFMMVGELELEDAASGQTRYLARAHHWTQQDCDRHAAMGFHEGWRAAAEQLVEVARRL